MNPVLVAALLFSSFVIQPSSFAAAPLRIFIRSGPKSHAPGAHDHPAFLRDWVPLLNERGAKCEGGNEFPTKEQLDRTDVLILHTDNGGDIKIGEERKNLMEFLKRGGGIVSIHAANVSKDHDWFKNVIGGSWHNGQTKWLEAPMSLYFTDHENPITKDISNFDIEDEIYYNMDVLPEVKVLAAAYTPNAIDTGGKGNREAQQRAAEAVAKKKGVNIYDIQPQMWTYESRAGILPATSGSGIRPDQNAGKMPAPQASGGTPDLPTYRAFVCIPGHWYKNFSHTGLRAAILRGIAWAGKRENVDELCKPNELGDALRYAEGGCPAPQDIPKSLEVHPEFDVSLVASEPLINKPMNIDWDEKGRLWVVETPEYPNGLRQANVDAWKDSGSIKPGKYDREPLDRVSILSDTNGDGIMDKKQVFADKLELATSSVFYKNGIIVCAAPDIWFFEDTDGDYKADKRTKLYTNLGTRDTHAVINNMRWGLDGWIYATHGYSSSENVIGFPQKSAQSSVLSAQKETATAGKSKTENSVLSTEHLDLGPIGSGVVRFKPDGSAFEQYSSRGGNTWGLDITSDGQVFYTQPTSGVLFHHVVLPEYVLAKGKLPGVTGSNGLLAHEPVYPAITWEQQAYVQIDQVGSYTAAAGCAIYEGGAWPDKWNYGYFTTEPTVNIVSHFIVEPDGVTFKTRREPGREQTEFIRSKSLWFRPIEVRVGPDGALYVVDFCNQAVIHNDTRGPTHGPANAAVRPDRDHYYGRIWKVQHREAKKPAAAAYRHKPDSTGPQGSAAFKAYEAAKTVVSTEAGRQQILKDFATAQDDWTRSALIAACNEQASACIEAALANGGSEAFVAALLPAAIPANTEQLITACANADSKSNALKAAILQGIAQQLHESPTLTPPLTSALRKLLAQPQLAAATLPLVTKWDKDGALAAETKAQLERFSTTLTDKAAPDEARINAAEALVAVGGGAAESVTRALARQDTAAKLQVAIIAALDKSGGVQSIVPVFGTLKREQQTQAFEAILKRPEAAGALLDAVKAGSIDRAVFAPGDVARLRSHPNKPIARRANELFKVNNAAKDAIIAKLAPEVEKTGNATNGKMLFTAACAVCHKLGDVGVQVGPPLDGMGAHGPAELLVHIVDPNREVDPSFWAFNITTKKGEVLQGVVTSENNTNVTLATQVGIREIAKSDIEKRENTRRSLMPEGLDALGPDALRDILAFICGDAMKQFRILHLGDAFTADSREGVFAGPQPNRGQVRLAKFGNVQIQKVPFFIQDPAKSAGGGNIIVLKGGPKDAQSQTFPAKVEVPIHVAAKRLQLLSGISGWGYPAVRDEVPAMKATVVYESGEKEEFTFVNGVHFSDYIRPVDVPGSIYVEGLTNGQQMRLLTMELTKKGVAKSLILESPENNHTVPVVVAITADIEGRGPAAFKGSADNASAASRPVRSSQNGSEAATKIEAGKMPATPGSGGTPELQPKEGGKGDGPLAPTTPVSWEAGKTKVLLIGGGSSHDFQKFFRDTDTATLQASGFSVHYTEDRDQAAAELRNADVAVISVNRKFFDTAAYRKALMDFAAAGKGIVMLHPGTWYGYTEWPELNAQIIGGGARGHDKIHSFEVKTVKPHAVMEGVPPTFTIEDELYYVNAEPEKLPPSTAAIDVLAETSPSDKFQKPHPSIWITQHPKARIVGIAPGHDARTHDHGAFKKLLCNAVKWASER